MQSRREYWESVYRENDHDKVGWYQPNPARSLRLIQECTLSPDAPIIDIGGGSSFLVDHLLDEGYKDVTVFDLSATALGDAQRRLGPRAATANWIEGDVTEHSFDRVYRVWHDRAAFHFLTDADSQLLYLRQLQRSLAVGGDAIIAAFALDAPPRCSGLPVARYNEESLSERLGTSFEPLRFEHETHRTPGGTSQQFLFGHFRRRSVPAT